MTVAEVYCGDVQMIAVGMLDAGEHLAHDKAAETSADRFHTLNCACLKADRSKVGCKLLRRKVKCQIVFEPFI